ncbi:hypothetical protein ADA01nite_30400 [Aneurinibacillus danicus]|uniref:Uncharacterized protein n=1 Tax=Aneurinibacillus danicus TaxID=267746 RepID=A0A511V9J5_9BACL|nr:hypothetical protein ADA01nite_30400 [Aneurinibacillus danicus]
MFAFIMGMTVIRMTIMLRTTVTVVAAAVVTVAVLFVTHQHLYQIFQKRHDNRVSFIPWLPFYTKKYMQGYKKIKKIVKDVFNSDIEK